MNLLGSKELKSKKDPKRHVVPKDSNKDEQCHRDGHY
jgi:hypothetical protein